MINFFFIYLVCILWIFGDLKFLKWKWWVWGRVKEFIVEIIYEKLSLFFVENYFMKVFEEVF